MNRNQSTTRPFTLLVKPASADCNLNCTYCFYLEKCRLYPESKQHRMSDEVLERMISSYLSTPQPVYSFGWQGGEPTLMGLDFFKKAVELQKKYGKPRSSVANGLQTNTTLITDEFAAHLGKYRFLVGVSLDGPEVIHNRYRLNRAGRGSFDQVMEGIKNLKKNKVEFNILVLVSEANAGKAREVYRYLVDNGYYYHQYIPCVEFDEKGDLLPFSINGNQWGDFMLEIFDEWYPEDTHRVSIRHFDSILEFMVFGRYNVCSMGGICNNYFVVEHNGDIYPCDFFVEPEKKLGNIMEHSWDQLLASRTFAGFASRKTAWNDACKECEFLHYCSGDCPKNRYFARQDPRQLSVLCPGWKKFYTAAEKKFKGLALHFLNENREQIAPGMKNNFINIPDRSLPPDSLCFCGSGKKYKNCHGITARLHSSSSSTRK